MSNRNVISQEMFGLDNTSFIFAGGEWKETCFKLWCQIICGNLHDLCSWCVNVFDLLTDVGQTQYTCVFWGVSGSISKHSTKCKHGDISWRFPMTPRELVVTRDNVTIMLDKWYKCTDMSIFIVSLWKFGYFCYEIEGIIETSYVSWERM